MYNAGGGIAILSSVSASRWRWIRYRDRQGALAIDAGIPVWWRRGDQAVPPGHIREIAADQASTKHVICAKSHIHVGRLAASVASGVGFVIACA